MDNPLVLVVDDNDDGRELRVVGLELAGYRVVSAGGGLESVEQARAVTTPTSS
jgi:CheY-like chemotaxis protein